MSSLARKEITDCASTTFRGRLFQSFLWCTVTCFSKDTNLQAGVLQREFMSRQCGRHLSLKLYFNKIIETFTCLGKMGRLRAGSVSTA